MTKTDSTAAPAGSESAVAPPPSDSPPQKRAKSPADNGAAPPFAPGNRANPGGRPKLPEWMKDRAPEALKFIADVASGKVKKVGRANVKVSERLRAAEIIVERYYLKVPLPVELPLGGGGEAAPDLSEVRIVVMTSKPTEPGPAK